MNIVVDKQAETMLSKAGAAFPCQEVSSTVVVSYPFYVRAARCRLQRPGSGDVLAQWGDAVAKLRYVQLMPGESIEVHPSGTAAIYSQYVVTPAVGSTTNQPPVWFKTGQLAVEVFSAANGETPGITPLTGYVDAYQNGGNVPLAIDPNNPSIPPNGSLSITSLFDRLPLPGAASDDPPV